MRCLIAIILALLSEPVLADWSVSQTSQLHRAEARSVDGRVAIRLSCVPGQPATLQGSIFVKGSVPASDDLRIGTGMSDDDLIITGYGFAGRELTRIDSEDMDRFVRLLRAHERIDVYQSQVGQSQKSRKVAAIDIARTDKIIERLCAR